MKWPSERGGRKGDHMTPWVRGFVGWRLQQQSGEWYEVWAQAGSELDCAYRQRYGTPPLWQAGLPMQLAALP
jgi:hypothetical protein